MGKWILTKKGKKLYSEVCENRKFIDKKIQEDKDFRKFMTTNVSLDLTEKVL